MFKIIYCMELYGTKQWRHELITKDTKHIYKDVPS